jgi:hypothetical protein
MHAIRDRKFGEFITFDSTEEDDRSSLNSDERQTREQMRLCAVVATSKASKPRNPNPKSTNCLKKKRPRQVPSAASETTQTRSTKPGAQKWRAQRKTTDVLKVPQSRRERETPPKPDPQNQVLTNGGPKNDNRGPEVPTLNGTGAASTHT